MFHLSCVFSLVTMRFEKSFALALVLVLFVLLYLVLFVCLFDFQVLNADTDRFLFSM